MIKSTQKSSFKQGNYSSLDNKKEQQFFIIRPNDAFEGQK